METEAQPKVRFFLREEGRTITRNLTDKNRVPGTRQLECYIKFGKRELSALPDGKIWTKQGDYKGSANLGWAGVAMTTEEKQKITNVQKRLGKFRIDKSGALIEYISAKMQTGIFILPDAWDSKQQLATGVYEPLNKQLNQWRHVITLTYTELVQRTDFSKENLVQTIKERMKNGVPVHISIPATATPLEVIGHIARTMDGKSIVDISNPKGVPTDLRKFIPYYEENKLDTKKLSKKTITARDNLANKLDRYFDQTGKTLSITESKIEDISHFLKWRIYDNEENKARNGHIINPSTGEAIGVGTFNKTKKLIKFFYNRAVDNFGCTIKVSTTHVILKEIAYDREMNDVYLSMDQLQEIFELKLTNERMIKHRALFIIGSLGGGYRVEDLHKISKPILEMYDNGKEYYTFHVVSTKTKARTQVPIPPQLNKLVEEYDFDTPVKVHDFRDDVKELGEMCGWTHIYKYKEQLADGSSKDMAKPFFDMLQPRTCRKNFCSLLYNFYGLSVQEASAFSGHESEEFLKYLQIDKRVKAQQLANKFEIKPLCWT